MTVIELRALEMVLRYLPQIANVLKRIAEALEEKEKSNEPS